MVLTRWDLIIALRAFGATVLALALVWLITAATDEGQLSFATRAGRTLPVTPLCCAVGVALVLGRPRVRSEVRALEALGRPPAESARNAAAGAALSALLLGLAIGVVPSAPVDGFYPRAPRDDGFTREGRAFVSEGLGVRVEDDGVVEVPPAETRPTESDDEDDLLPRHARAVAAFTTAIAGVALALAAARAAVRTSPSDRRARQRIRGRTAVLVMACVMSTLIAFQASAARLLPAWPALVAPVLLLLYEITHHVPRARRPRSS